MFSMQLSLNLEIRNGENLWQWSRLEIRLNALRWSTILQKQFIIIIFIIIIIIITKSCFQLWSRFKSSKSLLRLTLFCKKSPPVKFPIRPSQLGEISPPPPFTAIWKTLPSCKYDLMRPIIRKVSLTNLNVMFIWPFVWRNWIYCKCKSDEQMRPSISIANPANLIIMFISSVTWRNWIYCKCQKFNADNIHNFWLQLLKEPTQFKR